MIHINYLLTQRIENAQKGMRRVINPLKKGIKPKTSLQQAIGISLHARKRRRVECRQRGSPSEGVQNGRYTLFIYVRAKNKVHNGVCWRQTMSR